MRTLLLATTTAAALASACTAPAQEYRAQISNCRDSVEQRIKYEADAGRKILESHGEYGAFQELTVQWDSGTVQRVTVGPTIGPDGAPAVCVVARRHIGAQIPASATKQ